MPCAPQHVPLLTPAQKWYCHSAETPPVTRISQVIRAFSWKTSVLCQSTTKHCSSPCVILQTPMATQVSQAEGFSDAWKMFCCAEWGACTPSLKSCRWYCSYRMIHLKMQWKRWLKGVACMGVVVVLCYGKIFVRSKVFCLFVFLNCIKMEGF